jgi:curved DNA-binding protein CbpA
MIGSIASGRAMNYYIVLGVSQDADPHTIRSAFRALVRQYHPDAGDGSSAEKFRQILTAYETLNDPISRGHYDRELGTRRAPVAPPPVRVEPLMRPFAVEPLLGSPRAAVRRQRADGPVRSPGFDDVDALIDEWCGSWAEAFFGGVPAAPRVIVLRRRRDGSL